MRYQHHKASEASEGGLKTAFWLNLSFTLIEVVGGLYTNSLSILSDALHDLGDSLSLGLSWYFQKLGKRNSNARYTFGYRRFSLLGALLNALILLLGSTFILWRAIPEIWAPEPTNAEGMLYLALLGVLVNGLAYWRLRRGQSLNEKMVGLHLLEDVLGWLAVLLGSVLMLFFDLPFIDPLLSLLIALYILYHVYRNLRQSIPILMQAAPQAKSAQVLEKSLKNLSAVRQVEDLHFWNLDEDYGVFSVHLQVDPQLQLEEGEALKNKIRQSLAAEGIKHSTIELIPADPKNPAIPEQSGAAPQPN